RCNVRKVTSEARALGAVAGARPTGMVTRPKLRDPFQVVRMGPLWISLVGPASFAVTRRFPSGVSWARADDRALVARCDLGGTRERRVAGRRRGRLAGGLLGRSGGGGRGTRQRAARARHPQGRRLWDPRADEP